MEAIAMSLTCESMELNLPLIIVPALVSLIFKAGIYVYARASGTHNFQTRLYLSFLFALSIQNVSEVFALYLLNVRGVMAPFEATLFYAASIAAFAPLVHLALALAFDPQHKLRKVAPALVYLYAAVLEGLLFFTPYLIQGFQKLDYGFGLSITRIAGPWYFLFEIYSIATFVGVLGLSIYGARTQNTTQKRLKNSILMIAVTPMALLVVLVLGLLHFGIKLINWSVTFPFAITFFLVITAYAIHQHRLFDIEFFLPWSKVRKRKTAFYDRIRSMIAEIADLESVHRAVGRLADTLHCPVALVGGPRPVLALAGGGTRMASFPREELRKIEHILVASEIAETLPETSRLMKQHGVGAVVPFYPHSETAASWMLLGDSFSEQVYTPLDFRMVEQLFDRLAEHFLDKLVFMRSQLTEARNQLRTLGERMNAMEQDFAVLREENRMLREQNTRFMSEHAEATEAAVLNQTAATTAPVVATSELVEGEEKSLDEYVADFETRLIAQALKRCDGNKSKTARLLGLRPNTLHYKIERYGLSEDKKGRSS